MKKIITLAGFVAAATLPLLALAQGGTPTGPDATYLQTFVNSLKVFFNALTPLIFAGAVLGFLVGIGMYLFSAGNDKMKEKSKDVMKWGLIILVVMFSVYGIIQLIASIFGVQGVSTLQGPRLPGL